MADQVYDPVERRERYLRDRELKGRPKAKEKTPSGSGSRRKLTEAEKREREAIRESNRGKASQRKSVSAKKAQELNQLRANLNSQRLRITQELQSALKQLSDQAEAAEKGRIQERDAKLAKIAADREAKLASIPPIPNGAKGKAYEQHVQRRLKAIRRIKGQAAARESAVNSQYAKDSADAKKDLQTKNTFVKAVTASRQDQLQAQLKGSVDGARKRYDTLKEALKPQKLDQ